MHARLFSLDAGILRTTQDVNEHQKLHNREEQTHPPCLLSNECLTKEKGGFFLTILKHLKVNPLNWSRHRNLWSTPSIN